MFLSLQVQVNNLLLLDLEWKLTSVELLFVHMKVEAHCGASLLGFVSDHRVVMILQVPREALEFAGMSINFRSGKFWYSICPIFSKGHAEIFHEF